MKEDSSSPSEIILYTTEDGHTRVHCRFEDNTLWLTQAQMAELFQTTPQNITLHLKAIFEEGELAEQATCKEYLQVRQEGQRAVTRSLRHFSLPAVLAVGFRVRSLRGTQFRQWAIERLDEFLVKGFTMDDERLKNPPGPGHGIREGRHAAREAGPESHDQAGEIMTTQSEIGQQFAAGQRPDHHARFPC